jgi:hypothetical protein
MLLGISATVEIWSSFSSLIPGMHEVCDEILSVCPLAVVNVAIGEWRFTDERWKWVDGLG